MDYDAALADRPELIERLRSGDPRALVDIIEQVGQVEIESYEVRRPT